MLRDVAYQAQHAGLLELVRSDRRPSTYALGGAFNDGKGEPAQTQRRQPRLPDARFARVNILNTER